METDQSQVRLDRWQKNCRAILENGSVISCPDKTAWVEWMREAHASGKHVVVENDVEGFRISTVFLGINVNLTGSVRRSGFRQSFIEVRVTALSEFIGNSWNPIPF